jgi:ParB family chromosome partitioning protein
MTDIATTSVPETAADGVFGLVDPHTLFIGDNVREVAGLDADFIDSIRQHGVLVPVTVVRDEEGTLIVRDGQRRTLAAREATLPTIPVYVIPTAARDLPAWHVERVVQQIVANDQHATLNDAQRARGIQQLLDAGLSVARTAKLLSKPRKVVKSASEAAQSEAAMTALASGQLSLDQAAAVGEFADDAAAVARLIDASPGHFEHLLSRLRRERTTARVTAAAAATYRDQGYRVLDEAPRWGDLTCLSIDELVTAGGEPAADDLVAPEHWAVRLVEEERLFDAETEEPVEDADVDLDTQWSPARPARDGLRHFSSVVERWVPVPHFYCTDYTAVGLVPSAAVLASASRTAEGPSTAQQADGGGADRMPAGGQSRRDIMGLNRLSEAATEVRRRWVTDKLLAAKRPPKGAAVFVAEMLVRDRTLLGDFHGPDEAAALLGLSGEADGLQTYVGGLPSSSDGPAQLVTLALVLGALESRYSKDCWRDGGQSWRTVGPRELLGYLAANGYVLSNIERVVLGDLTAEEVAAAEVCPF